MKFNKPPEWGKRFLFPENVHLDYDGLKGCVASEIAVQMVDKYDNFVAEQIAMAARQAGISDCTVLNKAAILEAIEKQIPQRPDLEGDGYDDGGNLIYDTGYCPRCRCSYEVDYHKPKYCENCGQALDWTQEEPEENEP